MLQNILFVKDYLSENVPGSVNDKFHPSKLPPNHTSRYQGINYISTKSK